MTATIILFNHACNNDIIIILLYYYNYIPQLYSIVYQNHNRLSTSLLNIFMVRYIHWTASVIMPHPL